MIDLCWTEELRYYVTRSFDVRSKHTRFGNIGSIFLFPTLARPHSIVLEPLDRFDRNSGMVYNKYDGIYSGDLNTGKVCYSNGMVYNNFAVCYKYKQHILYN